MGSKGHEFKPRSGRKLYIYLFIYIFIYIYIYPEILTTQLSMPNCVFACFFLQIDSAWSLNLQKTFINYINIQMHIDLLYTLDKYILIY